MKAGLRVRVTVLVAVAGLAAALAGLLAPVAAAQSSGAEMDAAALQKVLAAQALPTLESLPVTATSHPFNGAQWQNVPIDLAKHGYVEDEYLVSGTSNVYDWVAGTDYHTRILRSGPYTTRILVRRPADMSTWSGRVVVEMINTSAGYDWTAIWSALWQRLLAKHDVYVGMTAKASVFPALQAFDGERYARLAMANPLPAEQQAAGTTPGDADYDANFSRSYENGLTWDMATQLGRLLKSPGRANPLGRAAKLVVLSGESQQGNWLVSYYKWFTPAAYLAAGRPIFDGYLAECFTDSDPQTPYYPGTSTIDVPLFVTWPINQTAPITDPLPAGDAQLGWVPARPVPWIALNSQWEYAAARGFAQPKSYVTRSHKAVFWQLAGCNHGWTWQYLYGDACAADLLKIGFWDPASYDWVCTVDNPEVPLYMAEKAAYEDLVTWIREGTPPPRPANIVSKPDDPSVGIGIFRDAPVYDGNGNALGGLRLPMVAVPIASFGKGNYMLTAPSGLAEIVPFTSEVLDGLYSSKADYVARYSAVADRLVKQRYLLRSDARELVAQAKKVTAFSD